MLLLVVAEHDNENLKISTLNTVAAAIQIGGEVHILVAGCNINSVSIQAAQINGVTKVLVADAPQLSDLLSENISAQVVSIAKSYKYILFPGTSFGKSVAPRVAAKLNVSQISDMIRVKSSNTFQRTIYTENVITTVQSFEPVKVITVRTTKFEKFVNICGSASIYRISSVPDYGFSHLISRSFYKVDRPDLTIARIVVSGGRGLGSAENFCNLIFPLAKKLGAAVGASRSAVDAGYAPNDLQVGQTGKIVAPKLYFAIGISGAIQHLAGIRNAKVIVAINKDEYAPIFEFSDYGLVGDLFKLVPELISYI